MNTFIDAIRRPKQAARAWLDARFPETVAATDELVRHIRDNWLIIIEMDELLGGEGG